MSKNMACNLETGVCEVQLDVDVSQYVYKRPVVKDKVLVEYFTDPLCSACFIFDTVIDEIIETYGDRIEFKAVMGGLLKKDQTSQEDRDLMADNIESLSNQFNIPMSTKLTRSNPVDSSYPPSLAYLAVLKQDENKALVFLKKLRQALYVLDLDISKEAVLVELVEELGLDTNQFLHDFYSEDLLVELEDSIAYTIVNGVTAFPTIVIYPVDSPSFIIRGFNDFKEYERALGRFILQTDQREKKTLETVLNKDTYLSTREIAERLGLFFVDDLDAQIQNLEGVETIEVNDGYYYKLR